MYVSVQPMGLRHSFVYSFYQVALGAYPGLRPPMIPGIDLVGSIEQTSSDNFTVCTYNWDG